MNRILILSPDLGLFGGVSNYIKLLKKQLEKENYQIEILYTGKEGSIYKDIFYPILILKQLFQLKNILNNFNPDVVHINPSLTTVSILRDFLFLNFVKKKHYPVLFFVHGWKMKISNKFQNNMIKKIFKKNFDLSDSIIVLANRFKNELEKLGINEEKIFVSSTMVETALYIPQTKKFERPYKILFCGNIKVEKGCFVLVESIPSILKYYPDTKFIFIGTGKELERLKIKVEKMGLKKNIDIKGYVSNEEKIRIFKKSHVFLFPTSHSEGFPCVILEAIAAGLPLVTTPNAGIIDAIDHGQQGFLLDDINPKPNEIKDTIIKLLDHPNLMKNISINNIRLAQENYDVKLISKNILNIYEKISRNQKG